MAINNHVVNTGGRGNNMFSETFHGLRRTQDGKLYYTLRDSNVGTFSNDGGSTELTNKVHEWNSMMIRKQITQ